MGAVVLFLSESAISSVKSFYKLRRAYQILAEIYNSSLEGGTEAQAIPVADKKSSDPEKDYLEGNGEEENEDQNFDDLDQSLEALDLQLSLDQELETCDDDFLAKQSDKLADLPPEIKFKPFAMSLPKSTGETYLTEEFIKSGVNLCFGVLQLVISMIPPALGKILSIIGFKGDKDASILMLWEATKSDNIHGALALLTLLLYYTGPAQTCDIEVEGAYPKARLIEELEKTRKKFPHSALWLLQEARMKGMNGNLPEVIKTLQSPMKIQMRQIEALVVFEMAMGYLDMHEFEEAGRKFILMTHLNTWSHALYHYVAGACYVELYRKEIRSDNPDVAKRDKYKKKAERYLMDAPSLVGRRKVIGRPMPLEMYLSRKIAKWKSWIPANDKTASIVDYVGGSPANEIIYFWNGYKRMPEEQLLQSLQELNFYHVAKPATVDLNSISVNDSDFFKESAAKIPQLAEVDELAVKNLLQSIILRHLGQQEAGLKLLTDAVMPIQRIQVKGKEDWIVPCGIYERAVFEWTIHGEAGKDETEKWLTRAANYGHEYDLSTRIGSRIQTGLEMLKSVRI